VRDRVQNGNRFGDDTGVGDVDRARDPGRIIVRNMQRSIRRTLNDERLAGTAGDFEVAAGATVAGYRIAVVTLLVCFDNPVSANAGDGRIDTQGEGPAIESTRSSGRIVRQTQRPFAIGRLIAKAGRIRNRILRAERANERSDPCRDERRGRVTKRRCREVRAGRSVRDELSLRAEGRGEEDVKVGGAWMRHVNRRNDLPHDARLGDADRGHCAGVVIENWLRGQIADDDRNFAGAARNVELTGAGATVAARRVLVVALLEAAQDAVAADRRTNTRPACARPAGFDGAGRVASIIGRRIAIIAGFGAIDDSVAASNAVAH